MVERVGEAKGIALAAPPATAIIPFRFRFGRQLSHKPRRFGWQPALSELRTRREAWGNLAGNSAGGLAGFRYGLYARRARFLSPLLQLEIAYS